ncbi:unnamed protein product [Aphanomyces euteiches]
MFRASKYRNVLGTSLPREEWYEELQLDESRLDLYPLVASEKQLAFVSQLNSGSCIEVKAIQDAGKANASGKAPLLLKGHTQRVNALEFYSFESDSKTILASGGDDTSVKVWNIASDVNECLWTHTNDAKNRVVALSFHPSASDILGVASSNSVEVLDIKAQTAVGAPMVHPDLVTGFAWKTDGSLVTSACQDDNMRVWDPRQDQEAIVTPGHQGRKAASIAWCKDDFFVTAGFNALRERELMLWDIRRLDKYLVRERIDSGTGLLIPSFDEDTNLLFLGGRGDKVVRTYELNFQKASFTALQQTAVFRPTWGLTRLPKRACNLDICEVARVFSIGQTSIQPISFTVPRREAANQFQADLYPGSRSYQATMSSSEWIDGKNATPLLEKVTPQANVPTPAVSVELNSSWNTAGGWGSAPTPVATPSVAKPPVNEPVLTTELSEKAKKLGSIQGNKFKYITGKLLPRSESYSNVASDGSLIVANDTHWATPQVGTGGPVMVQSLARKGKIEQATVLNGHKLSVTDIEFHPFHPKLIATASDDCTVQIWDHDDASQKIILDGHSKGVRCISFHPSADNVLASGSMDSTILLWDAATGQKRQTIDKFEESPFNISFNFDGSLFSTITRDRVLRVIDPRSNKTVSMACAHEGSKAQKVVWCTNNNSSNIVTVGFSARSERQVFLWDARNLLDPLYTTTIDTSGSVHMPYYDESSNVVYLVGRGDRSILTFEIDSGKLHPCSPFSFQGSPISAAALLPKRSCNVREVEVARFLLLTQSTVENANFSLPRAEKLKAYFQDDVYGPVRESTPSLTSAAWFDGASEPPRTTTLQPSDMPLLSEKQVDAPVIPKVIDFKAQKLREEEEKRSRDQQFERLHALAYQPTLHSQRNPHGSNHFDDDDDGWDD